jgi:hypothetical protein
MKLLPLRVAGLIVGWKSSERKRRGDDPRPTEKKYGRKGNMMKWKEQLHGDCPKRDAHSLQKRCDLVVCPDCRRFFGQRVLSNTGALGQGADHTGLERERNKWLNRVMT